VLDQCLTCSIMAHKSGNSAVFQLQNFLSVGCCHSFKVGQFRALYFANHGNLDLVHISKVGVGM
jgi:hypothetical protein